ncbi:hypothetical protein ECC02_011226 [Trypanosoma cruzi]|uniref:Uncharacterized protein n=1 Tax=Trypanosoma cruzi TaxID=5693 RepID=A0A7J6XNE9_TRYCR|nr:hypothetical protein ECC02_011226 [Trypanosoma cruzi]
MDGSIGGKLTPPQFIRAGVFMCRHIHRGGNGGLLLFPCTAGSTVATCVHRIGLMKHSTQLTIPAMHVHTKATESIILMLSLSTGRRTLPPRTHTHARDSSGCRHSEHTTHPPAQPPHPHHQMHVQDSQQPSRTRTSSSSSTRAQGPTRRRTVIIAVIVTRSGVAGASQLIREAEQKECNKRERDEVQRIQRERADNMRKGQQSRQHISHTTRRHPRKKGTQRQQPPTMQEEKISTTIFSQLIHTANGKWQKPTATTQRTRSEHPPHQPHAPVDPHPSMTRQQNFQPSRPQWDTEPNSTQSHAVHHTRRKGDSDCALPLPPPFSSWQRRKTTAATRNCQHALQKKHSNPLQCASCVCVPAETQSIKVEKREQSMWRDAKKCTAEVRGGSNKKKTAQTHDCTAVQAVAIHTRFV